MSQDKPTPTEITNPFDQLGIRSEVVAKLHSRGRLNDYLGDFLELLRWHLHPSRVGERSLRDDVNAAYAEIIGHPERVESYVRGMGGAGSGVEDKRGGAPHNEMSERKDGGVWKKGSWKKPILRDVGIGLAACALSFGIGYNFRDIGRTLRDYGSSLRHDLGVLGSSPKAPSYVRKGLWREMERKSRWDSGVGLNARLGKVSMITANLPLREHEAIVRRAAEMEYQPCYDSEMSLEQVNELGEGITVKLVEATEGKYSKEGSVVDNARFYKVNVGFGGGNYADYFFPDWSPEPSFKIIDGMEYVPLDPSSRRRITRVD